MSSDDGNGDYGSDVEQRMAFTVDNDFEDGRWIGNEFYCKSAKRGRQQTREERLYGVFANEEDEQDYTFRQRKKDRKKGTSSGKADLTKPINFVGGSIMKYSSSDESPTRNIDENGDGKQNEKVSNEASDDDIENDLSEATNKAFSELMNKAITKTTTANGNKLSFENREEKNISHSKPMTNDDFRHLLMHSKSASVEEKDVEEPNEMEIESKKPKNIQKPKPAKLDAKFGEWEKHTKGIGMKLMMKMGFTGRLGKHGTGVTRQQEVKLRPDGIGLGYGNFKEAASLKVNREIEADRQGKTLHELEKELGIERIGDEKNSSEARREAAEAFASTGLWRKSSAKRSSKMRYITASELFDAADRSFIGKEIEPPPQVIVDMRGPKVKYLNSADEIKDESRNLELFKPKLGQELLHNVHLIVTLAENEVISNKQRALTEEKHIKRVETEISNIKEKIADARNRLNRIEQLSQMIERISSRVNENPEEITATALAKAITTIQDIYPEEYEIFGIGRYAPELAKPVLQKAVANWSPIKSPEVAVALLSEWRILLEQGTHEEGSMKSSYTKMIERLIVPPVRSSLVNEWKVYENGADASNLMESLAAVLPAEVISSLIDECVLPKLQYGLNQWNVRVQGLNIYLWIVPWKKVVGSKLATLFQEIRRKLKFGIESWNPNNESENDAMLVALQPWSSIMDQRSFDSLLCVSVSPALAKMLRKDFIVDPSNQNPTAFLNVMKWAHSLPLEYMEAILIGEFFPKWHSTLQTWLKSGTADLAQVAIWYQGWKSLFIDELLSSTAIQRQFTNALATMDCFLKSEPLPPFSDPSTISYSKIIDQKRVESLAKNREAITMASQAKPKYAHSSDATFKEVVENFSASHGVEFIPKHGRSYFGRQVYSFGKQSIYLDQNVAYVEVSGNWTPISLDDLLAYTKNSSN